MTSARHRRHRRPAPVPVRRDPARLGALAVLAGVSALGAVAGPVADGDSTPPARAEMGGLSVPADAAAASFGTGQQLRGTAGDRVSRDQDRGEPARAPVSAAPDAAPPVVSGPLAVPDTTTAYAQDDTVARSDPSASARSLVAIDRAAPVAVTGRTDAGFAEVALDGAVAWVLATDLGPQPPPELSDAPCPDDTSVESGLTANTVAVHRAVCAEFPGLVHGGLRPGDPGEHGSGQALDVMVTGAKGDQIAAFLQEHAADLGIDNLIWKQRIWFVGRPHESWQPMADRGSVTANHYDHVHVGTR